MKRTDIRVSVTFLSSKEGGRLTPPRNSPLYRPHVVVGDPCQRFAAHDAEGRGTEEYLGVAFQGDGTELIPGKPYELTATLLYWPRVNYDALRTGETFTVREGSHVVGFGTVVEGIERAS